MSGTSVPGRLSQGTISAFGLLFSEEWVILKQVLLVPIDPPNQELSSASAHFEGELSTPAARMDVTGAGDHLFPGLPTPIPRNGYNSDNSCV